MTQPLVKVDPGQLPMSGLFPGVLAVDAPLWATGSNVIFERGGVRKARGYVTKQALGERARAFAQAIVSGAKRIYIGGDSSVFRYNATADTLATIGAGFASGNWSLVTWGTWLIGTNNSDVPQVWKNITTAAALGGVPFSTAKIMTKRGPHVLAMNTVGGSASAPNAVEWCSADDPETWTPAASNSAGNLILREIEGEIMSAVPLGDMIATYGTDAMVTLSYLGAPFYFGSRPALTSIGAPYGLNSIVSAGRLNFGMNTDGVFRTDGVSFDYIDDPAVRQWIKDNLNTAATAKINGFHDEARTQITFWLPTGTNTECSAGIGFNYQLNVWTLHGYGMSASAPREVDLYAYAADTSVHQLNNGVNLGSGAMTAYVQSRPLDAGTQEFWKHVDALRFQLDRSGSGITMVLGTQQNLTDSITWATAQTVTSTIQEMFWDLDAVYITLKLESTAVGDDWTLTGFRIFGEKTGAVFNG